MKIQTDVLQGEIIVNKIGICPFLWIGLLLYKIERK